MRKTEISLPGTFFSSELYFLSQRDAMSSENPHSRFIAGVFFFLSKICINPILHKFEIKFCALCYARSGFEIFKLQFAEDLRQRAKWMMMMGTFFRIWFDQIGVLLLVDIWPIKSFVHSNEYCSMAAYICCIFCELKTQVDISPQELWDPCCPIVKVFWSRKTI